MRAVRAPEHAALDDDATEARAMKVRDRPPRIGAEPGLLDPAVGAVEAHERVVHEILGRGRIACEEVGETEQRLVLGGEPFAEPIEARS